MEQKVGEFSIAYPFSKEAAAEIREPLLSLVLDWIQSVQETEDGYLLNFVREPEVVTQLAQLMQVERLCNPFMRMALVMESNDGPVKLECSGPAGTKDFLFSEFGLKRWIQG